MQPRSFSELFDAIQMSAHPIRRRERGVGRALQRQHADLRAVAVGHDDLVLGGERGERRERSRGNDTKANHAVLRKAGQDFLKNAEGAALRKSARALNPFKGSGLLKNDDACVGSCELRPSRHGALGRTGAVVGRWPDVGRSGVVHLVLGDTENSGRHGTQPVRTDVFAPRRTALGNRGETISPNAPSLVARARSRATEWRGGALWFNCCSVTAAAFPPQRTAARVRVGTPGLNCRRQANDLQYRSRGQSC